MVLITENVGKNGEIVAFLDQAMAIPATGRSIGTPASIRASEPPHTVAIEDEPFDSVISETRLDSCRSPLSRKLRTKRAPGELAVADLAPSRRSGSRPRRPNRAGSCSAAAPVQAAHANERIDDLLVLAGAERGDNHGLGFTAGEQRRAVCPRLGARPATIWRTVAVSRRPCAIGLQDRAADDIGRMIVADQNTVILLAEFLLDRRAHFGGCLPSVLSIW